MQLWGGRGVPKTRSAWGVARSRHPRRRRDAGGLSTVGSLLNAAVFTAYLLPLLLLFPPLEKGGWGGFAFRSDHRANRKSESPAHRSSTSNASAPAPAPFSKVGADFRARHRQGFDIAPPTSPHRPCSPTLHPSLRKAPGFCCSPLLKKGGWGDLLSAPITTLTAKANPPRTDHFRATRRHRRSPPFPKWAPTFARGIVRASTSLR